MSYGVKSTLLIIAVGEFSMGILGNAFIVLVNCMGWMKNRKIASVDLILTSLAISRICLLCLISSDCIILALYPDVCFIGKEMKIFDFFWTLTNHLNVWFATCLSIFYFFKIANFFQPLFLWMKRRIDRVIPRILMMCLVLSVVISLLVTENLNDDFRLDVKAKWETNLTLICFVDKAPLTSVKLSLNMLTLFPFSVSLISVLLLILSLWRHTRQMQLNATGLRDICQEAHMGAMKAVLSFLLLFLSYNLSFLMATANHFISDTDITLLGSELLALIYPSSHSFILILGNSKLRQTFLRVLWKVTYVLKRRNF